MADERRFAAMKDGRGKLVLPNYSSPFRFILQYDALDTAISKLDHALYDKDHNDLQNIYGDSPYYHVALDIYNALTNANSPDATNYFATIDDLSSSVLSSWGYGASTGFTVNTQNGTNTNGTYLGDSGPTFQSPKIIVAPRNIYVTTDDSTSFVTWALPLQSTSGFTQAAQAIADMNIGSFSWLAIK